MRGEDRQQGAMFSYLSPEQRVPRDHPLRAIRELVDAVLGELSPEFARLYAANGRPSIAPEKLLRALLLQVLYTVRSERIHPAAGVKRRDRQPLLKEIAIDVRELRQFIIEPALTLADRRVQHLE